MPPFHVHHVRGSVEEQVRCRASRRRMPCRTCHLHVLPRFVLIVVSPSVVKDIIIAVTSPGAAAYALPSFRILLNLSALSPSLPCPLSSVIFFRALSFVLSLPACLPLALSHLSTSLSFPLPPVCSSVSMFVAAIVAAQALLNFSSSSSSPDSLPTASSSCTASLISCLSRLLQQPPSSLIISPSLFVSSLSRALSSQSHSSNLHCSSRLSSSLASALRSRNLLNVARVTGVACVHSRSLCMGVCEWTLTMRVSMM